MEINLAYIALMALAIATGGVLLRFNQTRLPLTWGEKFGLGVGAFCGAMIGAKLPFVLLDWEGAISGVAWFSNGKTIMCGLAGAYLGVEIAKWTLDIRTKTGDSFAAPVAVSVAIGRLACFAGGCCFGSPTSLPWGVCFANASDRGLIARHPTQFYESGFHFLMAGLLFWLQSRGLLKGQLAKFYILMYLGFRFVTEAIRQNSPDPTLYGGLTIYQIACLLLAPIFILLWIRDARRIDSDSERPAAEEPSSESA